MGAIFNFFRRCLPEDPVRLVANVRDKDRVSNILEDIQGIGCRIDKPTDREGLGWRVIVDGTSDIELPEGTEIGTIPPHFNTELLDGDIIVRAGSWERTYRGTVYDIPLNVDGGGTSIDLNDVSTLSLAGSGTGTRYVVLTLEYDGDPEVPDSLECSIETAPTDDTNKMVIAHFDVLDSALSGRIVQDWTGGNIKDIVVLEVPDVSEYADGTLLIVEDGEITPLSPPDGPAVFVYDATGGVRWHVIDAAKKGVYRNDSDQIVDDYVRAF